MPIYYLPLVNVFPDLIHQCCANYEPSQRAVMDPSGNVLFHITAQSINEMFHFKTAQLLVPLSMKCLLAEMGLKYNLVGNLQRRTGLHVFLWKQ